MSDKDMVYLVTGRHEYDSFGVDLFYPMKSLEAAKMLLNTLSTHGRAKRIEWEILTMAKRDTKQAWTECMADLDIISERDDWEDEEDEENDDE